MEKISIARRRQERQATLIPIKTDHREPALELAGPKLSETPVPLSLLESLINEEVITPEKEIVTPEKRKRKFTVEITSGLERPLKMVVAIQPLDSDLPPKEFLTVKEASAILRISEHTLYRQLHQGTLSGLKIGRQWRVILTP
ncbi:MAG: helix-turn-helix domain-containing protein [bacterium]